MTKRFDMKTINPPSSRLLISSASLTHSSNTERSPGIAIHLPGPSLFRREAVSSQAFADRDEMYTLSQLH